MMLLVEVNSWWLTTSVLDNQFIQKDLNKSIVHLTGRFHFAVHLFSNRSHAMSEYGKNKKMAHEM